MGGVGVSVCEMGRLRAFNSHFSRRDSGPFQAAGSQSCPHVLAKCLQVSAAVCPIAPSQASQGVPKSPCQLPNVYDIFAWVESSAAITTCCFCLPVSPPLSTQVPGEERTALAGKKPFWKLSDFLAQMALYNDAP